ncbi:hypothetical protein F4821DRAFT_261392 [Hypoxylon rubiginosum]|uniref:Uncharacterized protein n=1 Tax=Hypoxylon rubiginosum TaxID=110542 RepID=A0ACC0CXK2_9PEZI|nr:hypothetical protein F4821DRAFT_261392 [Hypoxylon rubiginosum]
MDGVMDVPYTAQAGCCDSGVGRFDVLPSNPITTATWNVAKSQFVVIATSTSSSTTSSSPSTSSSVTSSISTSSSTSISSPTTSNPSLLPTSQPVTSNTAASTTSTGLSMGEKVGIGVGVGLGSLLLAVLTYVIWLLRKKSNAAQQQSSQESLAGQQPAMAYEYPKWASPPQELSNEQMNHNLRYELPVAQ